MQFEVLNKNSSLFLTKEELVKHLNQQNFDSEEIAIASSLPKGGFFEIFTIDDGDQFMVRYPIFRIA